MRGLLYFYIDLTKQFSYYLFTFAILLQSCGRFGNQHHPKSVELTITQKSELFNDDLVSLQIDSLANVLYVQLVFHDKGLKKFPFPKYKNKETLTGTAFRFELYANGKLVEGAGLTTKKSNNNYFGYNKWLGSHFTFTSDTLDILNDPAISFEIPFYAFQKLHEGEHELELKITQAVFCSPFRFSKFMYVDTLGDSIYNEVRNFIKAPLLACAAKFKLKVPPIFQTTVYGCDIELRNDSVYSPAGMDNTIWNSSYPDIYWTVSFPGNNFYCSSDYKKSTSFYDLKDTFQLFHYTPNDSISIGVWDHDNLSRDDYISYKTFSINQFPSRVNKKFSYGNLKSIALRMNKVGYINR